MKEAIIREHLLKSGLTPDQSSSIAGLFAELSDTFVTKHDLAELRHEVVLLRARTDAIKESLESQMLATRESLESQMLAMKGSLESRMDAMATKEMLERAIRVQSARILSVIVFLVVAMGAMGKLFG